jgi:NAD(P)-dependent dehydrogenase (short-subunit alcohol dehydrogenase family)
MNTRRLWGKTAIINGSSRGLGRAMAVALAEEGAHLALCDVDLENTQRMAQKVKELGRDALALKVDLSKYGEVQGLVEWGGEGKKWLQRSRLSLWSLCF